MVELYALLKEAKGIIFATPVYNGGASAQIKAIMDRCRAAVAADIAISQVVGQDDEKVGTWRGRERRVAHNECQKAIQE